MRRGLRVRPVTGRDSESADPMDVEAALRAVEGEVLKLALEVGLHLSSSIRSLLAWTTSGSNHPCPTAIASSNEIVGLCA